MAARCNPTAWVTQTADRFEAWLRSYGVTYERDDSADSIYLICDVVTKTGQDDSVKIRVSDHRQVYDADFSIERGKVTAASVQATLKSKFPATFQSQRTAQYIDGLQKEKRFNVREIEQQERFMDEYNAGQKQEARAFIARAKAAIAQIDKKLKKAGVRTNPAPAAAALYESWTGEPSTHETIVTESVFDHSHLADLARLVGFKLRGVRGQLKFKDPSTRLCSNETGTQLYIRGGDQAINLDDFNTVTRHPVDPTKELVNLGEIEYLYYSARKPFLGKEHTKTGIYKHKLGEESGNRPVLLYDTRSRLLSIAGGAYYIKPGDYDGKHSRGIVD